MSDTLPPFLMTSDPGSFARSTIVTRKPQIIRQVIQDNGYPPQIEASLHGFQKEIASGEVKPLEEVASEASFWNREMEAFRGRGWLELPWYFAETYFYRRLLEAVRYFQPGPWQGHDPFAVQKRQQTEAAADWLAEQWYRLPSANPSRRFEAVLHSCLWGNRADLSNYTVAEDLRGAVALRQEAANILIDHTARVEDLLSAGVKRVDLITDNAGKELLFDLALADFLLEEGWARQVIMHLKPHPFFVSDATVRDLSETLARLGDQSLGARLVTHRRTGRFLLESHPFWTRCHMMRQMPASLADHLGDADLVILKGDVNYRRLLDDRHWPHTDRLEDIARYFPCSFLAVRTLKGEIMVGLQAGQAEQLVAEDPDWLINGRRGLIHLVEKPSTN
jgi:hypothetical protein